MSLKSALKQAVNALNCGELIAYPTEAVFGLGCDPDSEQAVDKLLALKSRPKEKGLILVASHWSQLEPYADFSALPSDVKERVLASWPGPVTWVVPKAGCYPWLTGCFDSIAVRVSAHPVVNRLCTLYGKPIVSTSANPASESPATDAAQVRLMFGEQVALVIDAPVGELAQPTRIIDALSGASLRS